MQKQPSEGFFEKHVMRNLTEFTRKHVHRNPLLVFFCEFYEILKNTFFAEQYSATAFDCSSINSSEGSTGKRYCEL